jgi:hypothetical protein
MRKIAVLTVVLAAALVLSCTTTTGTDGGDGLLKYAFDWAYDIAKKWAEDRWDDWDSDTKLAFFDCVLADEKCMLGRPQDNSFWWIFFQNDDGDAYSVTVDDEGHEDGEPEDFGIDFNDVTAFSNSKLEEMMTFCLDDHNDFWETTSTDPEDYWWYVEVSSDYNDWFSGVDEIFRIWFFESQSDIDSWSWWGYFVIDCDGDGDDYDILYGEHYDVGTPHVEAPQSMPLSRLLTR